MENTAGHLFRALAARIKMRCHSEREELFSTSSGQSPLGYVGPCLEAASAVHFPSESFSRIQQNETLSRNNWAGNKRGPNFILGGLIPTNKALRWKREGSFGVAWGPSRFMNSICFEQPRGVQISLYSITALLDGILLGTGTSHGLCASLHHI